MTPPIPVLSAADIANKLPLTRQDYHADYYAMYSSILQGVVTDPVWMNLPLDDHVVHRGDGVFETLKCINGRLYNLHAHLVRLRRSAARIDLVHSYTDEQLTEIIIQTVRAGSHKDAYIRLLISRGPGSLSVNPYDCPCPQLYIMVSRRKPPFMHIHPEGARIAFSAVPAKPAFLATIKNCNYIQNMLMKKESVDKQVDFVVALDARGFLTESATENVLVLLPGGILAAPKRDTILEGTTMLRVQALARALVATGELTGIEERDISRSDMQSAPEILIVGTTPNVTSAVQLEGHPIGGGAPGPVGQHLNELLEHDMHENPGMLTPVWEQRLS
ncbi:MAG: peptidase [Spartobacteria bacterium]|nr:peptidase [Spartobacteria bacterium]